MTTFSKFPRFTALVLGLCATTSCVSSSTYEKLQHDFEEVQAENTKLKTDLTTAGGRITDLDRNLTSSAQEKDQMTKALNELKGRQEEADKRSQEFRELVKKFKSLIDSKTLLVKITNGRMVVAMATDVLFPSGSAVLSEGGKAAVSNVGQLLATINEREFQVEGHTDGIPIKSKKFASNWDLAASRAITVLTVLKEAGVPATRLSAASFGDTRPVQTNETSPGRAANRRIEIVVVPDLSTLPGFDELNRMSGEQDAPSK